MTLASTLWARYSTPASVPSTSRCGAKVYIPTSHRHHPNTHHATPPLPPPVRIPWVLLFLISLGGAAKQYERYGYLSAEQGFMILATGLYINACVAIQSLIVISTDCRGRA
jgi:hypothetical protein